MLKTPDGRIITYADVLAAVRQTMPIEKRLGMSFPDVLEMTDDELIAAIPRWREMQMDRKADLAEQWLRKKQATRENGGQQ